MRLPLYCSTPRGEIPNLVSLQDEAMNLVPTVLVCPLRADFTLTPARLQILHNRRTLIAAPELTRPIRRSALRHMGRLDEEPSQELMRRFRALLAH